MKKNKNLIDQTFVDFLTERDYDAELIVDGVSGLSGVRIGEDMIKDQDIHKSEYASLLRSYHFRMNGKEPEHD
jgi:hypothetical protein